MRITWPLVTVGLMEIARGLILLHDPGTFLEDEAVFWAAWPLSLRVGLWVAGGLLGLLAGLICFRLRWVGWVAVVIMPAERVAGHALSLLHWIIPGVPGGSLHAIPYLVWWGGILALIMMMAREVRS